MTILHTPISNATNAETQDGLSTVKLVTPASLYSSITSIGNVKTAIDNNSNATFNSNFTAKTATNAETQAGILNNKLVTPSGLLSAINDAGTIKTSITTITNNAITTAIPTRTYKDLTSLRQQSITYTNTTNADLIIVVNVFGGVNLTHDLLVDGFIVCSRYAATSAGYVYYGTLEATVPKGSTYLYSSPAGGQIQQWIELSAN